MKGKRIILAVTNDLVVDQRVHRVAGTLERQGADVLLVGRRLPGSQDLVGRSYRTHRMWLLFRKGFFFYAFYNFRILLFLLTHSSDIIVSNDLDTLPGCYLASRLKGSKLVFDSHELFTEVPELIGRKRVRDVWLRIEKKIIPRIRFACTVSRSVALEYEERYGIRMAIIRNLPLTERKEARRPDLLVCGPRRIIIYQGALNVGRGIETMIRAMKYLDNFMFQIFGDGDIAGQLRKLVEELELSDRIEFMGRVPLVELPGYTRQASLGISLEEDRGLNYRFSLPNKLFDYIQAGTPVLVSDLPEMKNVVENYEIGQVVSDRSPESIADQIKEMMGSDELRMIWKKNLRKAAGELCWQEEETKLIKLYSEALSL